LIFEILWLLASEARHWKRSTVTLTAEPMARFAIFDFGLQVFGGIGRRAFLGALNQPNDDER
jgi:hypothetical protein